MQVYAQQAVDAATEKPVAAAGTIAALLVTLFYLAFGRRGAAPAPAEKTKEEPGAEKEEDEQADAVSIPGRWCLRGSLVGRCLALYSE